MKLDFVTVAFGAEANLLILQARSFDRYVDPECVGNIYLVIDDDVHPDFHNYLKTKVIPEYGWPLCSKVKIVPFADWKIRTNAHRAGYGWYRQQALKMLIASRVKTEFYVILDGKNHFIRPIGYDYFVTDRRALIVASPDPKHSGLWEHHVASFGHFGIDADDRVQIPMSVTPFVAKAEIVLNIVRRFSPFYNWFMDTPAPCSEFALIIGYVLAHSNIEREFEWAEGNTRVGLWDHNIDQFKFFEMSARLPYTKVLSVSYRLFGRPNGTPKLTESERYWLFKLWTDYGLIKSKDEMTFLDVSPFASPRSHY